MLAYFVGRKIDIKLLLVTVGGRRMGMAAKPGCNNLWSRKHFTTSELPPICFCSSPFPFLGPSYIYICVCVLSVCGGRVVVIECTSTSVSRIIPFYWSCSATLLASNLALLLLLLTSHRNLDLSPKLSPNSKIFTLFFYNCNINTYLWGEINLLRFFFLGMDVLQ